MKILFVAISLLAFVLIVSNISGAQIVTTEFMPPKSCAGEWKDCSFAFHNDGKKATAVPQFDLNKSGIWEGYNFTSAKGAAINSVILMVNFSAGNSTLDKVMSADVNQDGFVNIQDISIVKANFGKLASDSSDPRADVNKNGFVNIHDITLVSASFGKSAPKPDVNTNGYLDIKASVDGGKTFGSSHVVRGKFGEQVYLIDMTGDFEWTDDKLNSTNLRIKATCFKNSFAEVECRLEWVPMKVSFAPLIVGTGSVSGMNLAQKR